MSYCLYSHRQTLKWNADRHVTVLYVLLCNVYTVAKVVIIYLLQALWNQILSRSSLKNLQTPPMWRKPWREFTTMIAVWLKSTLTTSRSAHWNVTIMKKLCTDKKKMFVKGSLKLDSESLNAQTRLISHMTTNITQSFQWTSSCHMLYWSLAAKPGSASLSSIPCLRTEHLRIFLAGHSHPNTKRDLWSDERKLSRGVSEHRCNPKQRPCGICE